MNRDKCAIQVEFRVLVKLIQPIFKKIGVLVGTRRMRYSAAAKMSQMSLLDDLQRRHPAALESPTHATFIGGSPYHQTSPHDSTNCISPWTRTVAHTQQRPATFFLSTLFPVYLVFNATYIP